MSGNQAQRAYTALIADITSWNLSPDALLNEQELAAALGVSRTPLRDALARLAREGLIVREQGQIARVARVSVEDAVALFQVREALESYSLRMASRTTDRRTFADLSVELASVVDGREPTAAEYFAVVDRFDSALSESTGNQHLGRMLSEVWTKVARLRHLSAQTPARLQLSGRARARVAQAVAEGDGVNAAVENSQRLRAGLDHIVSRLQGELQIGADPFEPLTGPQSEIASGDLNRAARPD